MGLAIHKYELETARRHNKDKENVDLLEQKLERSRRFAEVDLSDKGDERDRREIADSIRDQIKLVAPGLLKELNKPIREFERGRISLLELHQQAFEKYLTEEDPDSELSHLAFTIRHRVDRALKCCLNRKLPETCHDITDKAIDDSDDVKKMTGIKAEEHHTHEKTKFAERVEFVLSTALDFLRNFSNIKGIGIVYNEPITNKECEVLAGDVNKNRVKYIIRKTGNKKITKPITVGRKGDREKHLLIEMKFGDNRIGYIDFAFEGDYVDPIIEKTCRYMVKDMDTFLKNGLQNVLKELIQDEHERILAKYNLRDWRKIIEEHMKILHSIGMDPSLICKRFDLLMAKGLCEITKHGARDLSEKERDQPLKTVVANKRSRKKQRCVDLRYPSFIKDKKLLERLGKTPEETEFMGALLYHCRNGTEEQLAMHMGKALEDILRRREELRKTLMQVFGLQVANAYLDGRLEELGEHEIAILIGDINGYSKFSQALQEAIKKRNFPKKLIAEIMKGFTEQVNMAIDTDTELKGVLDKIVGDEVIVLFRVPIDNEGKDDLGKKDGKHDISKYINNALKMTAKIQEVLKKVLGTIEKKFNIKLPFNPQFSFGIKTVKDVVGLFGNPDNPYSRLQYTSFGTGINETARIQSAAKEGAILVDYKTWKQYIKGKQKDFVQVGHPFLVQAKNIKDPILVVSVLPRERVEAESEKQKNVLQEKSHQRTQKRQTERSQGKKRNSKDTYYFWDTKNYRSMPDGDYSIRKVGLEDKGPYILELNSHGINFSVKIPRDKIVEMEYAISAEMDERLNKEARKKDFSTRHVLKKIGHKFLLINHKSIEEIAVNKIQELNEKNLRNGQNYQTVEQIVSGRYEINGKCTREDDGDVIIHLMRGGTAVNLLIRPDEASVLRCNPNRIPRTGNLRHENGLCYFEQEKAAA